MTRIMFLTTVISICTLTANPLNAGPITERIAAPTGGIPATVGARIDATAARLSEPAAEIATAFAAVPPAKQQGMNPCNGSECSRLAGRVATAARHLPASMRGPMHRLAGLVARVSKIFR
jgi:hypothetical protein